MTQITNLQNIPEYSVSEVSRALKHKVEETFSRIKVRGEISGLKRAASGHLYMTLKDSNAVIDAVCWRGSSRGLWVQPEDGLEVIATGKLTTYSARSKYQLVIDEIESAGEGALLKLIEERRKRLASEGLFDSDRKQELPFLPDVIGVVTSPTGAVIRDILHRLRDRFPRRVLVWPVLVQGEGSADQITTAIRGFNALPEGGVVPRPNVLIIARGGGSLEDLWSFNEEAVVRAVAESKIPTISAVGHETDTMLIDFVADLRAPTPTGAAEMVVPVRSALIDLVQDKGLRLKSNVRRLFREQRLQLDGLRHGLRSPREVLQYAAQRLDDSAERLGRGWQWRKDGARRLIAECDRLLQKKHIVGIKERGLRNLGGLWQSIDREIIRQLSARRIRVGALDRLLGSLNYRSVLERGFAVIRNHDSVVTRAAESSSGMELDIEFADASVAVVVSEVKPEGGANKKSDSCGGLSEGKQENLI